MGMRTEANNVCPRCGVTELARARCRGHACPWSVIACPACDPDQAVRAFVADHEKDCPHTALAPAARRAAPALRTTRAA